MTADHPDTAPDRPLRCRTRAQGAQHLGPDYRLLTIALRAQFRLGVHSGRTDQHFLRR
jgi:hypothetical protein